MKTFFITHPHYFRKEELPETVMALGYFDGVHLGHQKVITRALEEAKAMGMESAVMTFDPHPSVVLGRHQEAKRFEYITPLSEKERIISEMGIDRLYVVNFTHEFAGLLPQEFIDQYVIGLNVKLAVAGFDFTYGKLGKGTMETMPFHSREQFSGVTIDKVAMEEEKISSTLIRSLISQGAVDRLPHLLGRHYIMEGEVIHGDKRGRTIGFPTANIGVLEPFLYPPAGVYAVRIEVEGEWHNGVCNVGYKPTFYEKRPDKPSIEVHIFDFSTEIYGLSAVVEWHKKLREEQKFAGIHELVAQISKDKEQAEIYFENYKGNTCFSF